MAVSLEYIAGFIDGEGHISIHRTSKAYGKAFKPEVSMTNSNLEVLLEIQKVIGGRIYSRDNPKHPMWKTQHCLNLRVSECKDLLPRIVDKLIVKREQALLLISVWNEDITLSEASKLSLALNRRGKEQEG